MKVGIQNGCCLCLTVVACWAGGLPTADTIVIGEDGQIRGFAHGDHCTWALDFGLPTIKPDKSWSDGSVFRSLWVTKGIRYTQTVFMPRFAADGGTNAILLVDIAGENTNGEYTEASAALVVELEGQRQSLHLKDGLLWNMQNGHSNLVAALEIQATGIHVGTGQTLRFRGSIPPSLKGSMTWMFPLHELTRAGFEALEDISFDEELQKAQSGRTSQAISGSPRIGFGDALNRRNADIPVRSGGR